MKNEKKFPIGTMMMMMKFDNFDYNLQTVIIFDEQKTKKTK